MTKLISRRRQNPFTEPNGWSDYDGPSAQDERRHERRQRMIATLAFVASLSAVNGTALVWASRVGMFS